MNQELEPHIQPSFEVALQDCFDKAALLGHAALVNSQVEIEFLKDKLAAQETALAEAERLNRIDLLTGLGNERAFKEDSIRLFERSRHNNEAHLGLLVLDVDGLKRVNEFAGHPEGDRLLRVIAEALRLNVRPTDFVYRLGSRADEFTVLMPDFIETNGNVENVSSRMTQAINEFVSQEGFNPDLRVGARLAVGLLAPNETFEGFFHRVDHDMLSRKRMLREGQIQDGVIHLDPRLTLTQVEPKKD